MTRTQLVVRYAIFAAIATLANLGAQRFVLQFGKRGLYYFAAMFVGTLVGLVIKYALDKRWIFFDVRTGIRQHGQKFGLYTLMGIATTAVFWGSESAFWFAFHTAFMRETGAVLGLAVGYVIKYRLDRRFVFTDAALARDATR